MELLFPTIMAILSTCVGAFVLGAYFRDQKTRDKDLAHAKAVLDSAKALAIEYQGYLAKINEIDSTRAQKMIEIQHRLEAVELKMSMLKANK